jgi:hypothetical protein
MNENEVACSDFMRYILSLKDRSWAELCWEEEEREEEEARLALKKEMEALDQERKQLYLLGEYQQEEGEVFD